MSALPRVRLLYHEAVPRCGSFKVRFPDGRASRYFHWDDVASRRLREDQLTSEQALIKARALARAEQDKISTGP
jgi:hypothetical protein